MSDSHETFSFAQHHKEKVAAGMDHAVARDNLLAVAEILDRLGIRYFLFFGTLLGAVREKGFIPHDTDTDVGVFHEFSERFAEIRAAAEAAGFSILRGEPGARLFSFMRDNEYLDCYVAKRGIAFPFRRVWDVDGSLVPQRLLDDLRPLEFLGRNFPVPSEPERALRILYGKNWRTPVKRFPGRPSLGNRIKRFLKQKNKIDALRRHLRIRRDASRGSGMEAQ